MEKTKERDPCKPAADILFKYLHDVIYKSAGASLDIESLPGSFHDFGKGLQYFSHIIGETRVLAKELASGNLNCELPLPGNEIAAPLKSLHASLKHLTWQAQQVTKGDYNQRVDFMGDFSVAFNNMIAQLDQRQKVVLDEKAKFEMYVRLILENCPNPILVFDGEGKLAYASDSFFQHYETLESHEALGKNIHDLFMPIAPEKSITEIEQLYENVTIQKRIFETEQGISFGVSQSPRHFKIQMTPMLDINDRSVTGVMVFLFDVTQNMLALLEAERARELAEQLTHSKSNFLARMSHEIRTPMNAILGMAELALREDVPPSLKEYISTIRQAGLNLLSIINDILDFSKIEAGKLEIVSKEYCFSSLINDTVNITKMKIFESDLRFLVNIDSNIPSVLFGDQIRIRQILLNLLSNAAKYTERGYVAFSVVAQAIQDDTVILKMEVSDSGKGIKPEEMGKLFTEFSRFDLEKNIGIEGTGLGLSITRALVKNMDGEITVSSEYGKGSVFTVILSQKIISGEKIVTIENPEKKQVLVYERREVYINAISWALDNLGVGYRFVSTSRDFLSHLENTGDSFALLASAALYEDLKKENRGFKPGRNFAVITDFGDTIPAQGVKVITMPVFSIPIANFLNDVSDDTAGSSRIGLRTKFTAPDAEILIVDDIETNLEVANGLLMPYGMRITLCKSGLEAIERIKKTRYDLVFMDRMMPVMDGIETVRRIRSMGNEDSYYKNVPIVAVTADALFATREMILKNGFDDFLSKPIDTAKMGNILETWLPSEKQKNARKGEFSDAMIEEQDTDNQIMIAGLDTKKAISMLGGKKETYLKILSLFFRDGFEKIKEIQNCFDTKNTQLYIIYVHALKSATAIVGADKLSETAKALERAGNQGDMGFINTHNAKFLSDLEELLHDIALFLSREAEKDQKSVLDRETLKNELIRLRKALKDFELNEISDAVDSLQEFTRMADTGDIVSKILQNRLIGEYDEAASLIDTLLRDLE